MQRNGKLESDLRGKKMLQEFKGGRSYFGPKAFKKKLMREMASELDLEG